MSVTMVLDLPLSMLYAVHMPSLGRHTADLHMDGLTPKSIGNWLLTRGIPHRKYVPYEAPECLQEGPTIDKGPNVHHRCHGR